MHVGVLSWMKISARNFFFFVVRHFSAKLIAVLVESDKRASTIITAGVQYCEENKWNDATEHSRVISSGWSLKERKMPGKRKWGRILGRGKRIEEALGMLEGLKAQMQERAPTKSLRWAGRRQHWPSGFTLKHVDFLPSRRTNSWGF